MSKKNNQLVADSSTISSATIAAVNTPNYPYGVSTAVSTITAQEIQSAVEALDVEMRGEMSTKPISIYEVADILSVKPDKDGFILVTIKIAGNMSNSDYKNYVKDGWPIYTGQDDWAFVHKTPRIYDHGERMHSITIKTKNPISCKQTWTFLNRQDNDHYSNEEVINAVKQYNEDKSLGLWDLEYDPFKITYRDFNDIKLTSTCTGPVYYTDLLTDDSTSIKRTCGYLSADTSTGTLTYHE